MSNRLALILLFAAACAATPPASRFGHFAYPEAPADSLVSAGRYRDTGRIVRLRPEAAAAFQKMAVAAHNEGAGLVPISGHRTVAYQKGLFERAIARHGSEKAAARWVAPPGHSEHHTGWTLDVGDASRRDTDVEQSFEATPAFHWLSENAGQYGFEISFPKDNPQGVSYEPWHWRYVGTDEARRLFRSR